MITTRGSATNAGTELGLQDYFTIQGASPIDLAWDFQGRIKGSGPRQLLASS